MKKKKIRVINVFPSNSEYFYRRDCAKSATIKNCFVLHENLPFENNWFDSI